MKILKNNMKVIYNTCYADPWIKVAQKLKDEHCWESGLQKNH